MVGSYLQDMMWAQRFQRDSIDPPYRCTKMEYLKSGPHQLGNNNQVSSRYLQLSGHDVDRIYQLRTLCNSTGQYFL